MLGYGWNFDYSTGFVRVRIQIQDLLGRAVGFRVFISLFIGLDFSVDRHGQLSLAASKKCSSSQLILLMVTDH